MERRNFLQIAGVGVAGALTACGSYPKRALTIGEVKAEITALTGSESEFWHRVRSFYVPPTEYVDLDHANTSPTPQPVFDAFIEHARRLSVAPAGRFGKMWTEVLDEIARPAVASYLGTEPTHLAFMANTTAALNTVLHGFRLRRGDEILVTDHEYPDMIETVLQRAKRDGIVMRTVRVPAPDEERLSLVTRVAEAITPRTRLLLISHVSAWSGEVFPVTEVTAAARARGVAVLVDAAQSVGILDVDFNAIGCDFMGASFHKGLGAPLPTGVLIMRPERLSEVLPLHPPSWSTPQYPMYDYEWSGTFNMAGLSSLTDALLFQQALGADRKRARLRLLSEYWQDRIRDLPGALMLTPRDPERWFGPASFAMEGTASKTLAKYLRLQRGILVQDKAGRHSPFANAIRVSPGAHATISELDRLVLAVGEVSRSGIS